VSEHLKCSNVENRRGYQPLVVGEIRTVDRLEEFEIHVSGENDEAVVKKGQSPKSETLRRLSPGSWPEVM
jgi:hypothetical protein